MGKLKIKRKKDYRPEKRPLTEFPRKDFPPKDLLWLQMLASDENHIYYTINHDRRISSLEMEVKDLNEIILRLDAELQELKMNREKRITQNFTSTLEANA